MEKENEKVLASGPKGNETAAGENSNYGTELQKGGGRDELEEREEVEKPPPSPFFYSSKQTPPLSPFGGAGPHSILSRDGLLLRQKLKMDNKSKKRSGGAEKHRGKKPKSLEVEAAKCAKLTDLFGAGFTGPAAAGAPGDERGGLDHDERVEAGMVDHLTCESLRSCSPSVHVRGLALCLPPLSAFTVDHLTCESLRSCFPDTGRAGRGVTLGLPFWAGLQLQI
ncbi:unnamed protein product [Pleuronectes platessa]|uniref:Uncharacterized protein n=1 Tax=Pleuronectes platessa TaxID=8262 RepID=A0A9N7YNI1_PLEPL|nr:unnamed protein product [Pleuronectes platessa]